MIIRSATAKDLIALTQLFDEYRVFYRKPSDIAAAQQFLSARLSEGDSTIYVCEEHTALLGFVQLYPLFSSTRMQKLWLLNDLYVNDQHRGKGISVKLIERAKELVKQSGACGMFLETEKSNVIGNNLYPKTGFELNTGANFYEWSAE